MGEKIKAVFTSGGFPKENYVARKEVEDKLNDYINTCRIITITGQTKSGKTVLAQSFFKKKEHVIIECGSITEQNDEVFWEILANKLGISQGKFTAKHARGSSDVISAGTPSVIGIESKFKSSTKKTTEISIEKPLNSHIKQAVIDYLSTFPKKITIILDDFHYLKEQQKEEIVLSFKSIIQKGLNLILIAIPNRKHEAVAIEKEIAGRVASVHVKPWSESELEKIAHLGFKKLNIQADNQCISHFARAACGSPHLMQAFCLRLSQLALHDNRLIENTTLYASEQDIKRVFKETADDIGAPLVNQLSGSSKGKKGKRKNYTLKDGTCIDVYELTKAALIEIGPGDEAIEMHILRDRIYKMLKEGEKIQSGQITNVITSIVKHSTSDRAANAIMDYDEKEKKLYLTDPFVIFYLQWGTKQEEGN